MNEGYINEALSRLDAPSIEAALNYRKPRIGYRVIAAAAAALSEKNATQLSLEAERLRTMLEQARTALQEFVTAHGDETAVNQAMQEAQAAFERASQNYKGAQSNEQAAQKAVKSMHEMQAKQTQAAEALREAETALTAADADVSQKTQACNLAKDRLENLKLDMEFGTLDDAKREAERLRTHAQKLFAVVEMEFLQSQFQMIVFIQFLSIVGTFDQLICLCVINGLHAFGKSEILRGTFGNIGSL